MQQDELRIDELRSKTDAFNGRLANRAASGPDDGSERIPLGKPRLGDSGNRGKRLTRKRTQTALDHVF